MILLLNYNEMEERWQKAWKEAKLFEPGINDKPSVLITAAFPYTNGPQHFGHLRTYATADVLARYKRMNGLNVLFPMGFHFTGTPLLAQVNKLKEGNAELIADFKSFGIPDSEMEKMKDPVYMGTYFANEVRNGMERAGYSIDWTRSFTSIDPCFNKMIEWQFGILNKKGYLVQGRHPVGWCPKDSIAVGMHDTKGDVEPEVEKETAIMFKVEGEEYNILCTTFRPETLPGVTNLFVNENEVYVKCKAQDSNVTYCISSTSFDALKYQLSVEKTGEIPGKDLLSKRCVNPFNGNVVPIFPGYFVKPEVGTGAVMSVPAHAPFDYVALMRLKNAGYPVGEIKPISVLEIPRDEGERKPPMLDIPALAYLEAVKADVNAADELIESATKLQYKEESHRGVMTVDKYRGMSEPEARDKMTQELLKQSSAIEIYVLTNEQRVYCRCMTPIVIKVVDNQWFLNYGNEAWKAEIRDAFKDVNVLPVKSRSAFASAIEWLNLRAVVRAHGLGTRFPLDDQYIIESLSDSTIYMSLYTIQSLIRNVEPPRLKPEFFDYVYKGVGDPNALSESLGIEYELLKRCRESFVYWYANTSRHSGLDLIFNHLTMQLFNHVAVLNKENWPKQIVVNGLVMLEGEKMSKSLGNIIMLSAGMQKYGADPSRFVIITSTDLLNDANFMEESVNGVRERFEYIYNMCKYLDGLETNELTQIDYWLYSRMNSKIAEVTEAMEKLELRSVSTELLFNTALELKRYFARGGKNNLPVRDYVSNVALMLQPIAPHISEEMWHTLGNTTFSSTERWPVSEKAMVNITIERQEALVDAVVEDVKQIAELMGKKSDKKPRSITLIVAGAWKRKLQDLFVESRSVEKAMAAVKDDKDVNKELAAKYLAGLAKRANEVKPTTLTEDEETNALQNAQEYIKGVLGCEIRIEPEAKSKSGRASRAAPLKPSIDIAY